MNIGKVMTAGLLLIRDHSGAAAVWATVSVAPHAAMHAGWALGFDSVGRWTGLVDPRVDAIVTSYCWSLVLGLPEIALWAAVLRACLIPDRPRFAYLRIGPDEARLLALGCPWAVGTP